MTQNSLYFERYHQHIWTPSQGDIDPTHKAVSVGVFEDAFEDNPEIYTEEDFLNALHTLSKTSWASHIETLVIGAWDAEELYDISSENTAQTLIDISPKLPNLKHLYFGDIAYEIAMISDITHTDLAPLLHAYPHLESFTCVGANDLRFQNLKHNNLCTLRIESGALRRDALQDILRASLPSLETLTLWFGSNYYGADIQVDDLQPLLSGKLFPKLQTLGLANSEFADNLTPQLVGSPIFERITHLDLSLGTLSDQGLLPLLHTPKHQLQTIDLRENHLSDEAVQQLQNTSPTITYLTDNQKGTNDRYVSVSE